MFRRIPFVKLFFFILLQSLSQDGFRSMFSSKNLSTLQKMQYKVQYITRTCYGFLFPYKTNIRSLKSEGLIVIETIQGKC